MEQCLQHVARLRLALEEHRDAPTAIACERQHVALARKGAQESSECCGALGVGVCGVQWRTHVEVLEPGPRACHEALTHAHLVRRLDARHHRLLGCRAHVLLN
eukprot:Mycagemm_TRINITY_DN9301_c0_g1::TRINITY_DN9301_c0_g1_i1::g.3281::m.3281 type:complete len:103 gc:universal TRINITY_DN9301_c0_g1_i1:607-915(+)